MPSPKALPLFPQAERERLLGLNGVGPAVLQRLEQTGHAPLSALAGADPTEVVGQIAGLMGSTCWKNSPQARAAIRAIIDVANHAHETREV